MSTTEEKTGWLTTLLSGWGVPSNWAKVIAGAIIGALAALGAMSAQSCTTGGTVSYTTASGATVTVTIPPKVEKTTDVIVQEAKK